MGGYGNYIPRADRFGTAIADGNWAGTKVSSDLANPGARGVAIYLNVGTASAGGTLSMGVEDKDPVSGAYDSIYNSVDVTANWVTAAGRRAAVIYPGAVETSARANYHYQGVPLPRTWRVTAKDTAGGTWSYSVGYEYLP